jgi:hypothetical protein
VPSYRTHVALTVWPIGALFILGLARAWPALQGAPAYAAVATGSWLWLIVETLVVAVSLLLFARGWRDFSVARQDDPGPYRTAGCIRLQKLAGGLAWAFVLSHLIIQWFVTVRVGPVALSQYELLRTFLSRPPLLGFYVGGLAALGLYLAQGMAASLRAWGVGVRPETSPWLEVGSTVVSVVLMLLAVNVLSHFVTGRAYWASSPPTVDPGTERVSRAAR